MVLPTPAEDEKGARKVSRKIGQLLNGINAGRASLVLLAVAILSLPAWSAWDKRQVLLDEGVQIWELNAKIDELHDSVARLSHLAAQNSDEDLILMKILYLHQGQPEIELPLAKEIASAIQKGCNEFKRDPDFTLAIMAIESNFNPEAVSSMGAVGLMQVMPQWKSILALQGNLREIKTNIRYGLLIYGFYENMYKDEVLALTAYNRGPGKVDSELMVGGDPSSNGYAEGVLEVYKKLKQLRGSGV